jgi:hypothetical protein
LVLYTRVKKNEIINYENTHISYYKKQKLRPLHTCEVRGSVHSPIFLRGCLLTENRWQTGGGVQGMFKAEKRQLGKRIKIFP